MGINVQKKLHTKVTTAKEDYPITSIFEEDITEREGILVFLSNEMKKAFEELISDPDFFKTPQSNTNFYKILNIYLLFYSFASPGDKNEMIKIIKNSKIFKDFENYFKEIEKVEIPSINVPLKTPLESQFTNFSQEIIKFGSFLRDKEYSEDKALFHTIHDKISSLISSAGDKENKYARLFFIFSILIFIYGFYKRLVPKLFEKDNSKFHSELEEISKEIKNTIDKKFLKMSDNFESEYIKNFTDNFKKYVDDIIIEVKKIFTKIDGNLIILLALKNIISFYGFSDSISSYIKDLEAKIKKEYKDIGDLDFKNLENKVKEYETSLSEFEKKVEDIEKELFEKVEKEYLDKALASFVEKNEITEEDLSFISETFLEPLYGTKLEFLEKIFKKIKNWLFSTDLDENKISDFVKNLFSKSNENTFKQIEESFPEFVFVIYLIDSIFNLDYK